MKSRTPRSAERSITPRDMILAAGVKNLKEYGYPEVTVENILTDRIYSAFFKSMLNDNLGKGQDMTIAGLLEDIEKNEEANGK